MVVATVVRIRSCCPWSLGSFESLSGGPCGPPSPNPGGVPSGGCDDTDGGAPGSPPCGIPAAGGVSAGRSPLGTEGRDGGSGKEGIDGIEGAEAAGIEVAGAEAAGAAAAGTAGGTRVGAGCGLQAAAAAADGVVVCLLRGPVPVAYPAVLAGPQLLSVRRCGVFRQPAAWTPWGCAAMDRRRDPEPACPRALACRGVLAPAGPIRAAWERPAPDPMEA